MKLNMERASALFNALTAIDTDENADISFENRMKIGANLNALRANVEAYQKALRAFTLKMNKDKPSVDRVIAAEDEIARISKQEVTFDNLVMMKEGDFNGQANKKVTGGVMRDLQPILEDGKLKEVPASQDLLDMLADLGKEEAPDANE